MARIRNCYDTFTAVGIRNLLSSHNCKRVNIFRKLIIHQLNKSTKQLNNSTELCLILVIEQESASITCTPNIVIFHESKS